jgi:predicted PurR-regulated permease PerM
VASLLVGILCFLWLIVPPFVQQFQELTYRVPQGFALFNRWLAQLESLIPAQLLPYLPNLNSLIEQAQPFLNQILGNSFAFVSSSLEVLVKTLLVIVLTGMFLAEPEAYRRLFIRLFPSFYRSRINGILDKCELSLEGWITGAFIAMSVVGILSVIGLSLLGVKAALALGVLAGFLNLIPNLGPTLSLIPAMAIALLDNPWKPLLVFILYLVIQQIDANLVTPTVMAHRVSLLPAVTLISQLFFVTFFGFLGLFLALPLTVVAKIWLQEVLIKDVLDEWENSQGQETELVIISQSSLSDVDGEQDAKIDHAFPQEE